MSPVPLRFSFLLVLVGTLSACAGMPVASNANHDFDVLYDGKSKAAYATQFPVNSAEEAVAKADAAAHTGDMDMALFYYVQALRHNPDDDATYYKIGAIHAQRNNPALAELALTQSLKLNPENASALESLGLLKLDQRNYVPAKKLLMQCIDKDPHRWRALDALGVLADLGGDYGTAEQYYKKALEYWPDSPLVLNNYGYSRYLAGDDEEAIRQFRAALKKSPQFGRSWMNLGLVYTRRGDYARALDAFRRVMSEAEANNNIGYLCMIEGAEKEDRKQAQVQFAIAESYLLNATRMSPSYYAVANENLDKLNALRKGAKPELPALPAAPVPRKSGSGKAASPSNAGLGHVDDVTAHHQWQTYRVTHGDTLYSIARRYRMPPEKLMELNSMHGSSLQVGQTLRLPLADQ